MPNAPAVSSNTTAVGTSGRTPSGVARPTRRSSSQRTTPSAQASPKALRPQGPRPTVPRRSRVGRAAQARGYRSHRHARPRRHGSPEDRSRRCSRSPCPGASRCRRETQQATAHRAVLTRSDCNPASDHSRRRHAFTKPGLRTRANDAAAIAGNHVGVSELPCAYPVPQRAGAAVAHRRIQGGTHAGAEHRVCVGSASGGSPTSTFREQARDRVHGGSPGTRARRRPVRDSVAAAGAPAMPPPMRT